MWELLWIQKEHQHHSCMACGPTMFNSLSFQGTFLQTLLGGAEKTLGGRSSRPSFPAVSQWLDSQESDSSRPQLSELQNGDNNALLGIHHVEVSEMLGFMSITISRLHRGTFSYSQISTL